MRRFAVLILAAVLSSACGGLVAPADPIVQHVSTKLTDSSAGFGLALLDQLLEEPAAGNVFISPLSATLLLGMASSGADPQTRAGMLKTLGLDPANDPAEELKATVDRLAKSDSNAQLELAQAVWVQQGLALDPAYVKTLRDAYHARLANLDFGSPAAPGVVNAWVDGATHHKISRMVDSFDPQTVGYLVNATYFHALWRTEFTTAQAGDFHTFAGATSKVPMMKRAENVTELTTPEYRAALLPYRGGRFSAVLILPNRSLSPADFAKFLTGGTWNQLVTFLHAASGQSLGGECKPPTTAIAPDAGVDCEGTLVMPKFQLDYEKDLTDTLRALGMPIPGPLPAFCAGCFLSQVVQKTYVQVDEKGTTAAAATSGAVGTAYHEPLLVDHPFAFALVDNASDAPIFIGAIGDL